MPEYEDKNIDLYDEFGAISNLPEVLEPKPEVDMGGGEKKGTRGKTGFVFALILILVVTGVGLGFLSYSNNIKGVFVLKNYSEGSVDANSAAEELLDLRDKDTDGDGLSDYDELYVYNTSPYLEDSDSDGYSDKAEIDSGHDPNCPAGQICLPVSGGEPAPSGAVGSEGISGLASGFEGITTEDLLGGNLSADELRNLLAQTGQLEQSEINGLSDEDLLRIYEQTLRQLQNEGAGSSSNSGNNLSELPSPENITPDQIRQLLILGGMSEGELAGIDDKTLLELYREVVRE